MQLGFMNDPRRDPCDELRWTAEHGFDFLDLTVEGPQADLEHLDIAALRRIVDETGIGIVGHSAPFLPFGSPLARLRQAAVDCAVDTFEALAALGAQLVNVHILGFFPKLFDRRQIHAWYGESFSQLAERAEPYGLRVMVEHPPSPVVGISDISAILAADERLGFHLDVGHAHVGGDRIEGLIKAFSKRLVHVHLSDNRGQSDDHRTLGDGWIDWPRAIGLIRQTGYDGTITLEVQSPDRDYVLLSKQKVEQWWAEAGKKSGN